MSLRLSSIFSKLPCDAGQLSIDQLILKHSKLSSYVYIEPLNEVNTSFNCMGLNVPFSLRWSDVKIKMRNDAVQQLQKYISLIVSGNSWNINTCKAKQICVLYFHF